MMDVYQYYEKCSLCPRKCGVNRFAGARGYCGAEATPRVARAALHFWEEPIISGDRGSGAIFFSGCSLGCNYCQNRSISRSQAGEEISAEKLADLMLGLQDQGAHNINLVTAAHFTPHIVHAVELARAGGLCVPIVYNTSGYETIETLKMLDGYIDIYLPDLKYYRGSTAARFSFARDYPEVAREAIREMVRQRPLPIIKDEIMMSGVVVRLLLLPGHVAEAKLNLKHLTECYGNNIYISLMSQYTPIKDVPAPLDRRVSSGEYDELVAYAERIGIENVFIQDRESAVEDFIPDFDGTGV